MKNQILKARSKSFLRYFSAIPCIININGSALTIENVVSVAKNKSPVTLDIEARKKVEESRRRVENCLSQNSIFYGINTGFGSLVTEHIDSDLLKELQRNIILSHSSGVGKPFEKDVVRAMMVCLIGSLSRGLSGIRPIILDNLIGLLNNDAIPVIPSIGSVGASGDLCPLAHCSLALIGEGFINFKDKIMPSKEVLNILGIKKVALEAKEGLALINGTHLMAGRAALLCNDFEQLFNGALCATALSFEAQCAQLSFLDSRINKARNFEYGQKIAATLRNMIEGSEIRQKNKNDKVQDPYSIRCTVPIISAAYRSFGLLRDSLEDELGAVTDNPLIFPSKDDYNIGDIVSGGNFHGMPLALPLDLFTLSVTHIAGISERRTFLHLSNKDNPMLASNPGLESGMMISQYTQAACCNELQGLCHPASINNITTCAGTEDYNSWGPRAASKAARAIELAQYVIAVELFAAAELLERRRPSRSSHSVEHIHSIIRSKVQPLSNDRILSEDINSITQLIKNDFFKEIPHLSGWN